MAVGKKEIIITADKPAPEFTPIILGAAIGLLSTAWIITPAVASAQPENIAAKVRGSRIKARILYDGFDISLFIKPKKASPKLSSVAPNKSEKTKLAIKSEIIIAIKILKEILFSKDFGEYDFCHILIRFIPSVVRFIVEKVFWQKNIIIILYCC